MLLSKKVILLVYLLFAIGMLESIVTLCLAQSYLLSELNIVTVTCFLMSNALAVAVNNLLSLVRPMALRHG